MKKINKKLEYVNKNMKYIRAIVCPRYWEDVDIRSDNNDYYSDNDYKNMPLRDDDKWILEIDVDTGSVRNWTNGVEASIHYKICDDGKYFILDKNYTDIAKFESEYVPSILAIDDEGYGDYIILTINSDGIINDWKRPYFDNEEILDIYDIKISKDDIKFDERGISIDGLLLTWDEINEKQELYKFRDKILVHIEWDWGRVGCFYQSFIMNKAEWFDLKNKMCGNEIYLGEVAGKHSEIYDILREDHITEISNHEEMVKFNKEHGMENGNVDFIGAFMNE